MEIFLQTEKEMCVMKCSRDIFTSKKNIKMELIFIALISLCFFQVFRGLFVGQRMFSHDTIRWYGAFHFFADSVSNGLFPYWDPYDFCGQPFYYNLGILRIYEPLTIGFIMLGKLFDVPFLTTYHWEYMIRIWLVALGVYFCFRQLNKYLISNMIVFGVFLFSSFTITSLRQNGVLYTFFWTPWAMFFLLKLLKNFNMYNVIGFSFFVGLSFTSYQGVYTLTYLFIFALTLLVNKRGYLLSLLGDIRNLVRIVTGVAVMIMLVLPLFSIYLEKNKIVPTARLDDKAVIEKGVTLNYDSIVTAGTHSKPADFIELVMPIAVRSYFYRESVFELSECFLYIGIFPLLLAGVGVFLQNGDYRINFLLTLILTGLLMLGPTGGIYPVLYFLFYPLRLARHMHLFSGFFIFTLFYFVGQGTDSLLSTFVRNIEKGSGCKC